MDQIAAGIGPNASVLCEVDRKRAIVLALQDAQVEDWVLIAGKGNEQHQETVGISRAFSDSAVVHETVTRC